MPISYQPTIKKQVSVLFLAKLLALIIQFITPIIYVRLFSKETFGEIQQFLFIGNTVGNLLLFGVTSSFYFFLPNALEKKGQLFSQSFLFNAIQIIIVILILPPIFNYLVPNTDDEIKIIVFFYICFFIISSGIEDIFIIEKKIKNVFVFIILDSFAKNIIIIIPFLFLQDVKLIFFSITIWFIAKAIFLVLYTHKYYKLSFKIRAWDINYFIQQLNFCLPLGASGIVGTLGDQFDKFIITSHFSIQDFATYSIAKSKIPVVALIFPSVSNVILPEISKCAANKDYQRAKYLWHKMIYNFALVIVPFIIYLEVSADELIRFLFTDKYMDAVNLYRIIVLTLFVQVLSRGVILNAFAQTKYIFNGNLIALSFTILLSFLLVPLLGLYGAALCYLLNYVISGFYQIYKTKIVLKLTLNNWLPYNKLFKILLISLIATPLILLQKLFILSDSLFLLLSGFTFFISVIILYIKFIDISIYTPYLTKVKNMINNRLR